MSFKKRKRYEKKVFWLGPSPMYVDRELITSEAYFSLKTTACFIVYGIFLTKRQMENAGDYYNQKWYIKNNGQITFTYKEALEKYGISNYKFEKAIANLVEAGFLEILTHGGYNQPTLYFLSDRWKLYGTVDFIKKEVPKFPTRGGFQKGNKYGRNCSAGERARYSKEIKEPKVQKLQTEINRLERDKLTALSKDEKLNRCSRIPAIIDQVIENNTDRLRKLQGT